MSQDRFVGMQDLWQSSGVESLLGSAIGISHAGLTTTWEKGGELEWPLRIVPA